MSSSGCVFDAWDLAGCSLACKTDDKFHHALTAFNTVTKRGIRGIDLDFNGTDAYVACGNVHPLVQSIELYFKPDSVSVTEEVIDLNGTVYITITNGDVAAQGLGASYEIYIDGISNNNPINTTSYHYIVVCTDTKIDATAVDIGRLSGSTYFDGRIESVRLYSYRIDS